MQIKEYLKPLISPETGGDSRASTALPVPQQVQERLFEPQAQGCNTNTQHPEMNAEMERQYFNTLRSINMLTRNQKHLFYKQSYQVEFILKQLVFIIQAHDTGENEIIMLLVKTLSIETEREEGKKGK